MPLHRLVYRSHATSAFAVSDEAAFGEVLRVASERNRRDGLTGALFYEKHVFVQLLEGRMANLEAAFERICCDQRHERLELLEHSRIDFRQFGQWSMTRLSVDEGLDADLTRVLADPRSHGSSIADLFRKVLGRREADQANHRFV